jgi:hypothetical protein
VDQIEQSEVKRIWFHRIDEAQNLDALAALKDELDNLGLPPAVSGPIRLKAIDRRRHLMKPVEASTIGGAAVNFAGRYGLPAPDGRPLYAYRLTDPGFAGLTVDLVGKDLAFFDSGHGAGLFALWAAEWFRREYCGGSFKWAELVKPLALEADQTRLRQITENGLRQWRRPVLPLNGRQFIGTLAREGGFPAAAMQEGGRGWARDVLAKIVGPLLASAAPDTEQAFELATGAQGQMRGLFRDVSFLEVCADLALAIVKLRREAEGEAAKAQLPVAAWLHIHRPGWTQALPLTTGDKVAEALVESLLKVEPVATHGVDMARLLVRDGQFWREALKLGLDGMVRGDAMGVADAGEGRLRAFPAGLLARHLSGELALFDPPGLGDKDWQVRSSRLGRAVHNVPFDVPVAFDLRSGERIISRFEPKLGKPRRGQLLVAVREEGADDAPTALRVVGSGSGVYRADPIFLRLPVDWRLQAVGQETATQLGNCAGGHAIWRISGGVTVIDDTGDLYRLRCGQAADEVHRLDLVGDNVNWAEVSGNIDLYQGAPRVMPLAIGELVMRAIGTRAWKKAPQVLPDGHYELGWRKGKELLDRRRIAILPKAARLDRKGRGNGTRYALEGFGSITLTPLDGAPVRVTAEGAWIAIANGLAVHHFNARMAWLDGPPLDISIRFPCAAAIARWDGQVLPNNSTVTLDDLPQLVAVDEGPMELVGELRGDRSDSAEMSWLFDQSMPLSAIGDDLVDLMMQSKTLESSVRLGMHDGIETYWNVRQFAVNLRKEGMGVVAQPAVVAPDAILCGRYFGDPTREEVLAPYSLFLEANHRPVVLPPHLGGLWIVYLRDGQRVLTRPQYFTGESLAPAPQVLLGQVMALPLGPVLQQALSEYLDIAGGDSVEAYGHIMELVDLAVSLNGLPPSTFEIFKRLTDYPTVLARMLLCAPPESRDAVFALSRALPFAWYLVPRASWEAAQRMVFENVLTQMAGLPADLKARSAEFAVSAVQEAVKDLSSRAPLAGNVLQPKADVSLDDAVQGFLRRGRERIRVDDPDRYRRELGSKLPGLFLKFDPETYDALDAPCAAALAALGMWQPRAADVRHIKTIARSFPTWFSEAFAATLVEHM